MACRVVVGCLVKLTMKVDFSISNIVLKYILGKFISQFITLLRKHARIGKDELLSDFDGVQEQATYIHHTYLHVVINKDYILYIILYIFQVFLHKFALDQRMKIEMHSK